MSKTLNIAMIGAGFMGRAHSQAWSSVNRFFSLPARARLRMVAGRNGSRTRAFAEQWGWSDFTTDVKRIFEDPEIDVVDIATPNHLHAELAISALKAGKHVTCEKPLAGTLDDARRMRDAAKAARKSKTFVWFNYRRCPAIVLARELARTQRIGEIYHIRANYLQEWGGSQTPMSWRFDSQLAGSGAHGDLNAHSIDLARFITGEEIVEVAGAMEQTFINARHAPSRGTRRSRSSVDDCVLFLGRFQNGAVASFEASRLATGNLNRNCIEINGELGAIKFDFERMNELQWWDAKAPAKTRGWTRIHCTNPGEHAYMDAYWPSGHSIGYEHGFISQAADIVRAISGRKPVVPSPDFEDAYQTQRVLHAAIVSARERRPVDMKSIH